MIEVCKPMSQESNCPLSYRASWQWSRRYDDPRSGDLLLISTNLKKALRILPRLSQNKQRIITWERSIRERRRELYQ